MKLLIAGISAAILVTGCGVTQDGFSSNSLQKRKYTKGFYHSKRSHLKAKHDDSKNETVIEKETITNDEAVVLNKKSLKTATQSNEPVVQQRPNSDQKSTEKTQVTTVENQRSGSQAVSSVEENSSNRISRNSSREAKSVLKKHDSSSKSSHADDLLILCIILCFFIPPLAVGIWTNIDWTKVLISLLLTILFFIPGLIYSLLVVLDKI